MTTGMQKQLCDRGDVCDVCGADLAGKVLVNEEVLGEVHTFCTETCLAGFLKETQKTYLFDMRQIGYRDLC
jgi:hypothetical protein